MASLSLPRVLQLKKNSLDAEREQFEKFQTLAIQKAINSIETPVKEKHVRSTIIGTFQEQSAITYWMVAIRQPLQDNRIVAWKFCHVTHKLLREGHPACLDDSQRHIGMIVDLGKLWVHLREGYGKLVHLYCSLLVCKLKFHARNPRFPGNMQLTADELDAIAENDVNNYFQLCVELFDYMDEILNLQAAVFDSLGNARANSMTASGQCRLAALIPCAQDASQIYDCNVRLLFRLHASLPADTLSGHRERFRQQFKKLSSFYKHASSLQYYRNLLTLPVLPSNPPNFLLQSDFGTYVTPVVSIPEPSPDEIDSVASLIDTSDTISLATTPDQLDAFDTRATPSPQPDPVVERDRLIEHLQNELRRMRNEVIERVEERNKILGTMKEMSSGLESQVQSMKNELEEERKKTESFAVQTPEIKQKLAEAEEKAKVTDEKFQKLKGAYTQLREEHINLIRQKAEVDKLTTSLRAVATQHESAKAALQQQLNDRMKDMELLQQSASSSEEIEAYKSEIANLRIELEQSRQKESELETLKAAMEALEIEHKTAKTEHEEVLNTTANDLKETKEVLEKIKVEKEERETELKLAKAELLSLRETRGDELKRVIEEKETALKQVAELTEQYQREKEELILCTNKFHAEIESLQKNLIESETRFNNNSEKFNEELKRKDEEMDTIIKAKDIEIRQALDAISSLQSDIELVNKEYNDRITQQCNEIEVLSEKISVLNKAKDDKEKVYLQLELEKETIQSRLNDASLNIKNLERDIQGKDIIINEQKNELAEMQTNNKLTLEEFEHNKNEKIETLKHELQIKEDEKATLENVLEENNKVINDLSAKCSEITTKFDKSTIDYDEKVKEKVIEVTILNDKLKNVTESKDEIIESLKKMLLDKDNKVITLNVELTKLSDSITSLEEELTETKAELEICKNEYLILKEEHENIIHKHHCDLLLKNREFEEIHDKLLEVSQQKDKLLTENEKQLQDFNLKKEVLESNITEKMEIIKNLQTEYQTNISQKEAEVTDLNSTIYNLQSEKENLQTKANQEIEILQATIDDTRLQFKQQITEKDQCLKETLKSVDDLKAELEELKLAKKIEKQEMEKTLLQKDNEKQSLESKLEVVDNRRLNAESELQDILQQNTVLEADMATLKIQLEEAKRELEIQNTRIMTCAGESALEITQKALEVFEGSQEWSRMSGEIAAKAFDELSKVDQVKGNEEVLAKSAFRVAHSTAQVSAYITEVSNVSTDVAVSERLNSECKAMLTTTKQCLEALVSGELGSAPCADARAGVSTAMRSAVEAERPSGAAHSVDDELAGMDQAIEEAASQIESLLTATRASDSGVQLEVNSNILDACTALMAAVKELVRESRELQEELGDTHTRQKMYRKNPQWSEGLISASKAVVFAAKLLVSSADESVSADGRVEGVSAAAHEVAGSTAQLVAASRARAPPRSEPLRRLHAASRRVAAAAGAVLHAARAALRLRRDLDALDTSALTLTATRRLEMECKVHALELETALEAERAKLAALRKRHYQLAQQEEGGNMTNGKE